MSTLVANAPLEKKPFTRKNGFQKNFKKSPTKGSKKENSKSFRQKQRKPNDELKQVEDEVNFGISNSFLEEEILLTPDNIRSMNSLRSYNGNLFSKSQAVVTKGPQLNSKQTILFDKEIKSEEPSQNNLFQIGLVSPLGEHSEFSQPSSPEETQKRQIKDQILSLLNMSSVDKKSSSVPDENTSSKQTPKRDRVSCSPKSSGETSPSSSSRWAGLSSSPAPNKLPIPLFVGSPVKSTSSDAILELSSTTNPSTTPCSPSPSTKPKKNKFKGRQIGRAHV